MQPPKGLEDIILLSCNISCKGRKRSGEYMGFIPSQIIEYNRQIALKGTLILCDGKTIDAIWTGKYTSKMLKIHNEIMQLNYNFSRQKEFLPLQDVYVIKGSVPVKEVKTEEQRYYVIINGDGKKSGLVAAFITYPDWIKDFIIAMNTPKAIPVLLPKDFSIYDLGDLVGRVAYQIRLYARYYESFVGDLALMLPDGTIIPYGISKSAGSYFSAFILKQLKDR